ncbi:MAG: hypothetical protein ABFC24_09555 [Methanoregulaceae archaeon]
MYLRKRDLSMQYRMVVWALPAILLALVTTGSAYSAGYAIACDGLSGNDSFVRCVENVTVAAYGATSPVPIPGENSTRTILVGNITLLSDDAVSVGSDRKVMFVTVSEGESPISVNLTPSNSAGYMFTTVTVTESELPLPVNGKVFVSAVPRVSFFHDTVPENQQHEWIDLDWADPLTDLELMVYTPDATLGPYNDTSDLMEDDRIFLDIGRNGTLTPGDWFFRVRNLGTGAGDYTLNTYSV